MSPRTLRLALAAACLALTGCATQPPATDLLPPHARLAVLQLPPSVGDDDLRRVLHSQAKQVPAGELAQDREALQRQLAASLRRALEQARVPMLRAADVITLGPDPPMEVGQALSVAALAALRARHPADAYLRIRLTDYGLTPKHWRSAYVGFEVLATLGIGALLYVHETTRPLAGLYLLQEGVEEYSEGYAGWWLLNRLSRPVRIEADLVDGTDGRVLWQDSETGLAGWRWGHLWHMDAATRDALLQTATDRMSDDLMVGLEGR